jgi:protein-S-isoprenylcysteine O-methyltransferase Ste14
VRLQTAATGAAVVGTALVLLPAAAVALNRMLGWPRWRSDAAQVCGGILVLAGVAALAYCARVFRTEGRGTPVPIEPPRLLVRDGPYRWSRNPMYVADVAILLGLFLHRGELALLVYAIAFTLVLHLWIVRWEEPVLIERFGADYVAYMRAVPRWIGPPSRAPAS